MSVLGIVLSGGGARAAYQVGVLSRISERLPGFRFPILTGTSAGAINATFMAGHEGCPSEATRDLIRAWKGLTVERMFRSDTINLAYSAARWVLARGIGIEPASSRFQSILDTAPLREYLDGVIDIPGVDRNVGAGRVRALALTALRYSSGENITFVHGPPDLPLWERHLRRAIPTAITLDHVMASSALPLVFPAVKVDEDYYGDGAVRHGTPLSAATHLGATRILAIAGQSRTQAPEPAGTYPSPAQIFGHMLDSVFLDSLDADAERAERINRLLDLLPPETLPVWGLRPIDLMVIRPSKDVGELAADFVDEIPRTLRILLRGLGAHRSLNADLLSYLMFTEPYVSTLIALGQLDADQQWDKLGRFLNPVT